MNKLKMVFICSLVLLVSKTKAQDISDFNNWRSTQDGILFENGITQIRNNSDKKLVVSDLDVINFEINKDGHFFCREIVLLSPIFPDYVFEKGYNLMSLKKLEKYINTWGHLPKIPSAQKVKSDGIGLLKLNILQMEKIEELILYMIDLDKKIDKISEE